MKPILKKFSWGWGLWSRVTLGPALRGRRPTVLLLPVGGWILYEVRSSPGLGHIRLEMVLGAVAVLAFLLNAGGSGVAGSRAEWEMLRGKGAPPAGVAAARLLHGVAIALLTAGGGSILVWDRLPPPGLLAWNAAILAWGLAGLHVRFAPGGWATGLAVALLSAWGAWFDAPLLLVLSLGLAVQGFGRRGGTAPPVPGWRYPCWMPQIQMSPWVKKELVIIVARRQTLFMGILPASLVAAMARVMVPHLDAPAAFLAFLAASLFSALVVAGPLILAGITREGAQVWQLAVASISASRLLFWRWTWGGVVLCAWFSLNNLMLLGLAPPILAKLLLAQLAFAVALSGLAVMASAFGARCNDPETLWEVDPVPGLLFTGSALLMLVLLVWSTVAGLWTAACYVACVGLWCRAQRTFARLPAWLKREEA